MLSSFTVNYTIVALPIFPQHQKQNTKLKTAMLHSPDAMAPGKDTVYGIRKQNIPVKRLYRDFEIFKERYSFRGCVLEGKDNDSLYRWTPKKRK
jgi:hypothetical protein